MMSKTRLVLGLLIGLSSVGWSQRLVWIDWPPRFTGWYRFILAGNGRVVYFDSWVEERYRVLRWTEQDGWWYLRADGGLTRNPAEATLIGYVDAASYDGNVVVGSVPRGSRSRAYRWRLGRGIEYLADPPGAVVSSWALGVSADGNIVAGQVAFWPDVRYLARWHADGQVEIHPDWHELHMWRLSPDGRVITGYDWNYGRPFRWVEGRGVHSFPHELGPASAISYDGRILGGNGSGGAYRWKVEEGVIEWLVPFGYANYASAGPMSWDGRVVAGWYVRSEWEWENSFWRGFVWREGIGAVDLYEAFRGLWPEWVDRVEVEGLSANGRYLLGLGWRHGGMARLFWLDMGRLGDVDGDGCVDDGDLLEVLFSFGEVGMNLRGDLDGDGMVGESDLLEVLLHFGEGC